MDLHVDPRRIHINSRAKIREDNVDLLNIGSTFRVIIQLSDEVCGSTLPTRLTRWIQIQSVKQIRLNET